MVCESMRYKEISHYFGQRHADNDPPTPRITLLQNWWSTLSYALMRDDANPRRIGVLGMVLFQNVPVDNSQAVIRQVPAQYGRHLLELFNMRDLNINSEGPGKLYGAITAINQLQSDSIYKRGREDHESIEAGQNATLTGPSRTISAADYFTINFNLKDRDASSADDEVAQSQIIWNANDQTNNYGKLRTETINGPFG
ncbi:Ribosome-inactivating protein [Penicillium longicatenatum]|uniref:Ribosome-inactivating protein n=1 Tax=Penicillium longicatenatum TaxID=1561947 RepID=UPI002546D68C|nr:Ribosome-inactivating protein [Penicillium longicatenatum]KAJ5658188.1 Ribosome-inactivating protein [Penicillium longicatenatum]